MPEWPAHLQAALDGALERAEGHSQATIEAALDRGDMQMWAAPTSFCLTELRVTPTGMKLGHLFLAGGDLEELRLLYPIIEGWAKSQGCVKMTMLGRTGWERTFFVKDEGFTPTMRLYEKELS